MKFFENKPKLKKLLGLVFVLVGFVGIITPFTPWGVLFFIGLEFLGIRFLFIDKIKAYFKKKEKIAKE
jgi:uncharacterized protein YqgC (DUF456 family)